MNTKLNQHFILPQHRAPLETAIAASSPGREPLIADLYLAAMDTLNNSATEHPRTQRSRALLVATKTTPSLIVATATDPETGFFVQLVGDLTADAQLIFGKKLVAEHRPGTTNSSIVKIWR